jgi:Xaa-Pro aminopeptidase
MLNGVATMREIRQGEVVRIDVIGLVDNYYCDVARTAVVGEPAPDVASIWQKLVDCRDMALDMIKPGVSSQGIYNKYIEKMDAWKLPTLHFLGHGLGLTLHEEPYLNRYKDCTLEEGMVLAIEPLVVLPELGMQLEEAVIVTRDGCEVITNQFDTRRLWQMSETARPS